MVRAALDGVGGQAYLMRQAKENPRAFLALIGLMLAAELRSSVGPRRAHSNRTSRTAARRTDPSAPDIPAMVRTALSTGGGVAYLIRQAEENPRAFLALVGKMLAAELRLPIGLRHPRVGSVSPAGESEVLATVIVLPDEGPLPVRPPPVDAPQAEDRVPAQPSGTRDLPVAPPQPRPSATPRTAKQHPAPQAIPAQAPKAPQPPQALQPPLPEPSQATTSGWRWRQVGQPPLLVPSWRPPRNTS